jgi:hypothetical protein
METGFGSQRGNQNIGRCNSRLRLPAVYFTEQLYA